MKIFLKALILLMAFCSVAKADHDADVHFAAHFGVSYMVDDLTFRFSKRALRMSDWQAQSFAAFTTLFIGLVYKAEENASGGDMIHSTLENAAGVGAASAVRWAFDF